MAVVVRFLVLTREVPFILILSAMLRNLRELMHFKGIVAYGILKNFLLVVRIIESLEILTQRAHFSRYRTVKIIGYVCLYEFFQVYY